MSDDDQSTSAWQDMPEERRRRAIELKTQIGALVSEYVDTIRTDLDENVSGDDRPFVQAWAVACEWTNIQLEQNDQGGRDVIAPEGQTLSNTLGLGAYLVSRYE